MAIRLLSDDCASSGPARRLAAKGDAGTRSKEDSGCGDAEDRICVSCQVPNVSCVFE